MKTYKFVWTDRIDKSVNVTAESRDEARDKFNNEEYDGYIQTESEEYIQEPYIEGEEWKLIRF